MPAPTIEADPDSASDRQGIQVISRAAALLRALQQQPEGMSLGELSKAVALPRSTVQRIVDALDREGLVLAASSSHGVRLGPALLPLASAARFPIAELARSTIEALSKACKETVDLSVLDQDKVVFIDQVAGSHRLTALSAIGVSFPLHCSANGKVLLAALDDAEIGKLRKRLKLHAHTPHTITSWSRLDDEIATIRQSGVAYDREENSEGISAVSVALRSPSGEWAAISIPVPTQRFEQNQAELTRQLIKHVGRLANQWGP